MFHCGVPLSEAKLMIIKMLPSINGRTFFKRSFLKTLYVMGKRLIGRQDVSSLGGFPGFWMRIIWATFHCAGRIL
jgi:hypothetical protein